MSVHSFAIGSAISLPCVWQDEKGEYLRLVRVDTEPKPIYRMAEGSGEAEVEHTANGDLTRYASGGKVLDRTVEAVTLHFEMPAPCVLTGLGQYEDGVLDYTGLKEYLCHLNMIISIPFLLSSEGWGLWLDADCAMQFSAGEKGFSIRLEAAENATAHVIRGQSCADVLRHFAELTGKPAMLPKWAFGYVQSKERYKTADELLDAVAEFRRRGIGLDCIVEDWMSWKGNQWGDKTPDPERFPDVPALTKALHDRGVHFMISVWPSMNSGADHDAFAERGWMLPASDVYNAFLPEACELYWQQCRKGWLDSGTDALWCDSAEPFTDEDWRGENKMPQPERYETVCADTARHIDEAHLLGYARAHCSSIAAHWREDIPGKRVVNLCRSGYAGAAKDGVIVWSGDTCATWDTLSKQITEGIKASSSGLAYWTLDIGAFFVRDGRIAAANSDGGPRRTPPWFWRGAYPKGVEDVGYCELYTRWMQMGAMLPMFRSHGTDTPREPWNFAAPYYDAITGAIALRYRLLPYFYAAAHDACETGLPMMRALMTAFPHDSRAAKQDQSFMMGDALLVSPVTGPIRGRTARTAVYLPEGHVWHDWFTGEVHEGGQVIQVDSPLDTFPLFVKSGSIVPVSRPVNCTGELTFLADGLEVFAGSDGVFTLYDDAGDGTDIPESSFACVPVRWDDAARVLTLQAQQGGRAVHQSFAVTLHTADGQTVTKTVDYHGNTVSLTF